MILPIIGVIGFQSYWIINTYEINEERFQKDIKSALTDAIELDIITQTKKRIPEFDSVFSDSGQIEIIPATIQSENTKGLEELMSILASDSMASENMTIHISGNNKNDFPLKDHSFHNLQDSMLFMGDTSFLVGASSGFDMSGSWQDLMLKVVADLTGHDIQLKIIDSIYKTQLLEKGLEINYELALYKGGRFIESTEGDSLYFMNPDALVVNGKIFSECAELKVKIPEKTSFLLLNMWISLSTSLLLIIVVIGVFIYMLTVILRQKRLSDMKNDFISNMTHEFKTPIATVSAAIESMQNFGVLKDSVKTETYLNISRKELVRLNSMVEKVLDISAYENQKVNLNKETINLIDIIKDVVERFRLQNESNTSIIENLGGEILILADRMHIQNIINNLLDNAVKYCAEAPIILVTCSIKNGKAELCIKDNGIGISKDHQKLIFDKFYRAPGDSMHTIKGFGLGLSYVKHAVEQHEGNVSVLSKPDAGSEFIIEIPISHESR